MSDIVERLRAADREFGESAEVTYGEAADEIERLRKDFTDLLRLAANDASKYQAEIERLRAYKTEIEHWIDLGERMIEPAAEWGPGGNVMVQTSTMFKLGAWWADRPWRVRETLGE